MTPGQMRTAFSLFVALAAGVAGNAMVLQSSPSNTAAHKAAAERTAQKAALDRQRRLAIDPKSPAVEQAGTPGNPAILNNPKLSQRAAEAQPAASGEQDKRPAPEPKAPQRLAAGPGPQAAIRLARIGFPVGEPPQVSDVEGGPDTVKAVQRELNARGYGPVQVDGVPGLPTRAAIMAFEHDARLGLTGEASEALLKRLLLGASGPADTATGKVRSPIAESLIRTIQQSLATLGYQPGKPDGRIGDETERAIREFEMDQGVNPTGRISADLFARLSKAVTGIRSTKAQ